jgi:peptide/nickel transport system substrate-binding protein
MHAHSHTGAPIRSGCAALMGCLIAVASTIDAATLRWSGQGDYLTADPHAQNEGMNNNINDLIHERLVMRDQTLKIIPALAVKWERTAPTVWRFDLRKDVTFHDGTPFNADDVVFSINRAQSPTSNFKTYAQMLGKVRKIDDFTVEFTTTAPNPIMLEHMVAINVVSKKWVEANGVSAPQDFKTGQETFASRRANGTGPYMLVSRESEVKTVLKANPNWWGRKTGLFTGNAEEVIYRPIKSDATRMAALLTGEIDFVIDPPLQDLDSLKRNGNIKVVEGPENRVLFLVFDQFSDELKYSSVKGKNPFKDIRVRQAMYQAIDVEAIRVQVMRGQSRITGAMVPASVSSDPALEARLLPYNVERAKALLKEAGYSDGFEVDLLCPNNRYVNDERICTAIAAMLSRIGIRTKLTLLARAQFFPKVDNFDFSFHLYGWGGAPTDPGLTLSPVLSHNNGKGRGDFNSGRFKDPELDALIGRIEIEMDTSKRRAMMLDALQRVRQQIYTLPLHRQVIPWAMRKEVTVVHRADNVLQPIWATIK